jgi:hypothetical protein
MSCGLLHPPPWRVSDTLPIHLQARHSAGSPTRSGVTLAKFQEAVLFISLFTIPATVCLMFISSYMRNISRPINRLKRPRRLSPQADEHLDHKIYSRDKIDQRDHLVRNTLDPGCIRQPPQVAKPMQTRSYCKPQSSIAAPQSELGNGNTRRRSGCH